MIFMRRSVFAALLICAVMGLSMVGCDLLDKSVLMDDSTKTTITDSTKIRVMSSVPDSTQLVINTEAPWHAEVAKGGEWCTLSKQDGRKGRDTIYVRVQENTGTSARQTSIIIESGNLVMVFRVSQLSAEQWHDTPYWNRTATQRMGLHGVARQITVTDNRRSTEASIYNFDERGNLLIHKSIDKVANQYDTTRTYTYDEANHRLTCTVTAEASGATVRNWRYEYENTGMFVAVSAKGWMDQDPLAEQMEGMIVPDLSGVFKTWFEDGNEVHEDRLYSFDGQNRLIITRELWTMVDSCKESIACDTTKVSYQYFNSCKMLLPYTSRGNVTNCGYYANGMLKMLRTATDAYDFLDNQQCMGVVSYSYTGPMDEPHSIDSYECEYNTNHDLIVKRTRFSGSSAVEVLKYPEYQYDAQHNWTARVEELLRAGYTEAMQNAIKREIIYW